MRAGLAWALVLCVLLPTRVRADEPTSEPMAFAGVIVAAGGLAIMTRVDPCCCRPNTPYIKGGAVVVGAGVFLVYLGMRPKKVTVVPRFAPREISASATVRWGGARHPNAGAAGVR